MECEDSDGYAQMTPVDFTGWAGSLLDGGWTTADRDAIQAAYFSGDDGDVADAVAALLDTMREIERQNSAEASQ